MSKYYSPLRYPGGKNCIYPFMSSLILENGVKGNSYAEPFAGGAGLALHLLFEGDVSEIYLNDYDHSIYAFWHTILNHTNEFCDWIQQVEVSMKTWIWAKNMYTQMGECDLVDLAKATFFLNRTNVSGIILGGPIGGPLQKGKYRIDARFNKQDLIMRIQAIAEHKDHIHIFEMDGLEFLRFINSTQKSIFIYIDPPYVKKGADLYLNFFKEYHHVALQKQILQLQNHWLVSYDNNDLIHSLYSGFTQISYTLSQCTSNRSGDEVIIFPNDLKIKNSLLKLKSPIIINQGYSSNS